MNTNKSLYIPIYEFYCDNKLIDNVVEILPNLNYDKDKYDTYISESFYHKELFQWFEDCINKVKTELYNESCKLEISTCWINRLNKLQKIYQHHHMNSIVSGVLYFSTEQTGKTIFNFLNPWYHAENTKVLKLSKSNKFGSPAVVTAEVTPEKGKLILFPSSISHETSAHNSSNPRYTLAFNTFITGNLEQNVTGRLNLKLN